MAKESDSGRYRFVWIVLTNNGKITSILLIPKLWFVFVLSTVDVIVDWILDSAKTKPAIQDSSAVLFVTLAEARILMQLCQDLIQRRYWMIALQMLELLLDGPAGQLIIFALLQKVPMLT